MTYLTLPPPRVPLKDKSYYAKVPDTLIIDIGEEVTAFFEETDKMRYCELFLDEVLTEVMLYISDANFIETGIRALQEQFREIHRNGGYDIEDGDIVANAVVKLARALVSRFKQLGAYLPDGCLPFELGKRWIVGCETPILTKQLEYQTTIENRDNNEYYREEERLQRTIQNFDCNHARE